MRRTYLVALAVWVAASAIAEAQSPRFTWKVITSSDALDAKRKTTFAVLYAEQELSQFSRNVKVHLSVECYESVVDGHDLGAILVFTETVAIGERMVRWRVDGFPVRWLQSAFGDDGKSFT